MLGREDLAISILLSRRKGLRSEVGVKGTNRPVSIMQTFCLAICLKRKFGSVAGHPSAFPWLKHKRKLTTGHIACSWRPLNRSLIMGRHCSTSLSFHLVYRAWFVYFFVKWGWCIQTTARKCSMRLCRRPAARCRQHRSVFSAVTILLVNQLARMLIAGPLRDTFVYHFTRSTQFHSVSYLLRKPWAACPTPATSTRAPDGRQATSRWFGSLQ